MTKALGSVEPDILSAEDPRAKRPGPEPGPGPGKGGEGGRGRAAERGSEQESSGDTAPSFAVLLLPPQRPSVARSWLRRESGNTREKRRPELVFPPLGLACLPLLGLIGQARGRSRTKGASGHVTERGGVPPALLAGWGGVREVSV